MEIEKGDRTNQVRLFMVNLSYFSLKLISSFLQVSKNHFLQEDVANNHIDAIESLILVNEIEKEDLAQPYSHKLESEISIYETDTTTDQSFVTSLDYPSEQSESVELNFTYSAADKKLCFIGNDAESIPSEIINQFGLKTIVLDISFNCISDLKDLEQFPYIEELICDNNFISENSDFPKLNNLRLFSCNKNKVCFS